MLERSQFEEVQTHTNRAGKLFVARGLTPDTRVPGNPDKLWRGGANTARMRLTFIGLITTGELN